MTWCRTNVVVIVVEEDEEVVVVAGISGEGEAEEPDAPRNPPACR